MKLVLRILFRNNFSILRSQRCIFSILLPWEGHILNTVTPRWIYGKIWNCSFTSTNALYITVMCQYSDLSNPIWQNIKSAGDNIWAVRPNIVTPDFIFCHMGFDRSLYCHYCYVPPRVHYLCRSTWSKTIVLTSCPYSVFHNFISPVIFLEA